MQGQAEQSSKSMNQNDATTYKPNLQAVHLKISHVMPSCRLSGKLFVRRKGDCRDSGKCQSSPQGSIRPTLRGQCDDCGLSGQFARRLTCKKLQEKIAYD